MNEATQVLIIFFGIIIGVILTAWAINRYYFTPKKQRKPLLMPVQKQRREWSQAVKKLERDVSKPAKSYTRDWKKAWRLFKRNLRRLFGG